MLNIKNINKKKKLPNFIIVGSMKSGTTSIHHWLMRSKNVAMINSETHFFNDDFLFKKGVIGYLDKLPYARKDQIVGEDTPTYSYLETVPGRIASMLPKVKILWMIRDPLERAISQYWHAARKGSELRSINQAFNDELNNKTNNIFHRYLERSFYEIQIKRFLNFFDKTQIQFINFHNIITNLESEKKKITNFLGILPIEDPIPHSNETTFYPRPWVNQFLKIVPIPIIIKKEIRKATSYQATNKPLLDLRIREESIFLLKENNFHTSQLVGFDFWTKINR